MTFNDSGSWLHNFSSVSDRLLAHIVRLLPSCKRSPVES